jgi:hypothetical protein
MIQSPREWHQRLINIHSLPLAAEKSHQASRRGEVVLTIIKAITMTITHRMINTFRSLA